MIRKQESEDGDSSESDGDYIPEWLVRQEKPPNDLKSKMDMDIKKSGFMMDKRELDNLDQESKEEVQ